MSLGVAAPQRRPLIRAFNLTWPGARTSPPASRLGDAHRKSSAVSSHDVSAGLRPANEPEGGSAPASPSDPSLQFNRQTHSSRTNSPGTPGSDPVSPTAGSILDFAPILRPANEPRGGSAKASPSDPSHQFKWPNFSVL